MPFPKLSTAPQEEQRPVRVLFVCLGNICRSPSAEGVFRHYVTEQGAVEDYEIDSAGLIAVHEGELPDGRMLLAVATRWTRARVPSATRTSSTTTISSGWTSRIGSVS